MSGLVALVTGSSRGIGFAAGIQNDIDESGDSALRLTIGYLSDSTTAINGEAEIDTLTFDALYVARSGKHRFAVGPTLHLAPRYQDNVSGFAPVDIEFDDAIGFKLQYGYQLLSNLEIGARVTKIDYSAGPLDLDAGSVGVYLSNGF